MRQLLPFVVLAAVVQGSGTAVDVVKRDVPAVITIRVSTPSGEVAGSGFVVDSSGTIITNLHVIEGATAVAVKLTNGDSYDRITNSRL